MYDYNILPHTSEERFQALCKEVQTLFPGAHKEELLHDVDGSLVQAFTHGGKRIVVYNDEDVGALYVKSDLPLSLKASA